ncbi:MAG: hypothetical protein H7067_04140 [Burkholderiales bacterium]|nr:hypothetical protein [Opitutaceae bacterium]
MLKTIRHKFSLLGAAAALSATLATPSTVIAGVEATGKEGKDLVEEVKKSCITGDLGVTFVSQYVSRGVVLENQSVIAQPYADLYFKLYEGDGFVSKVSLILGIWASINEDKTDAGAVTGAGFSSTDAWYEFDYTPGVAVSFAKYFTLTSSFFQFLSPNDGFQTFSGINFRLDIDDSSLLGAFALKPHFTYLREIENKAGTGSDEGNYYEVGINPSLPACGPVTVSLPVTAGFGSDDFYGELNDDGTISDEWFGYVSAGVNVACALKFIPECYGTWTATAGTTYYYLGPGTSDFNTRSRGGNVRDFKTSEWVFSGGLGVAF